MGRAARAVGGPPPGLKAALDRLYLEYDRADAVADPIEIVRRYPAPADREVVGFCAAGLAYGRVAGLMQSIERLAAVIGPSPASFVRAFDPARHRRALDPLVHRWTRGPDLAALLLTIRRMLERSGSIEGFFLEGHDRLAPDVGPGLEAFARRALDLGAAGDCGGASGLAFFFPRPSGGSACKRLNLYLRWMVRADSVDLGVWRGVSSAQLVVPLDVHVVRVGRCLGLTRYRSPGWRMAAEITASLRALDPADPVRYDFALCHVGMRDQCGFNRPKGDSSCPLRGWCRPGPRRRRASRPPSGPR